MTTDIATRAYNHSFRIDPIVRSLLDTDFYKLLMVQMIWLLHRDTRVSFSLINRSTGVRLADVVRREDLVAQLDHARTVGLAKNEAIWLAGNTFYGTRQIFRPDFLDWLASVRLPDYDLAEHDGQYSLRFEGPWCLTSLWEVPALSILNELRSRAVLSRMSRFEMDVLYSRAKAKLWAKVERLRTLQAEIPFPLADFGSRRRHGFLWQRWCVEALKEGLGGGFIGTSNVKHAMDLGLEAIGTNAHELPMVYAALAEDDAALARAPFAVLEDWSHIYHGNLLVLLPDAYGTTWFLEHAPDAFADWKGARPDSLPPIPASEQLIDWWRGRGRDPREKLIVLSDGMTVESIEESVRHLQGRARVSVGWGTDLTNDFAGCMPRGEDADIRALQLVCKVAEANGRPAVKLSDNPAKASGPPELVARYRRVFAA